MKIKNIHLFFIILCLIVLWAITLSQNKEIKRFQYQMNNFQNDRVNADDSLWNSIENIDNEIFDIKYQLNLH